MDTRTKPPPEPLWCAPVIPEPALHEKSLKKPISSDAPGFVICHYCGEGDLSAFSHNKGRYEGSGSVCGNHFAANKEWSLGAVILEAGLVFHGLGGGAGGTS